MKMARTKEYKLMEKCLEDAKELGFYDVSEALSRALIAIELFKVRMKGV